MTMLSASKTPKSRRTRPWWRSGFLGASGFEAIFFGSGFTRQRDLPSARWTADTPLMPEIGAFKNKFKK
jgi:hypothetical protein